MRYVHVMAAVLCTAVFLYWVSPIFFVYAAAAMFVFLSFFLPGYVVLKRYTCLGAEERIAASFGITAVIYIILGATVATSNLQVFLPPILGIILFASLALFVADGMHRDFASSDNYGLWSCVALWLSSLFFMSLPIPGFPPDPLNVKVQFILRTPAADNYIPYRVAQFLANDMPVGKVEFMGPLWGFFDRTPLMGLVTFVILKGVNLPISLGWSRADQGFSYPMFQIIGSLLNSLILLAAYVTLKRMFSGYVARVSIGFLLVNAFVLFNTLFTWPKNLVGYFVLLSWYFLGWGKRPLFAGLFAGLAYLSHDIGAIYVAGAFLYLLIRRCKRDSVKFVSPLLALVTPWLILSRLLSGHLSLFFLYIISVGGLPTSRDVQPLLSAFLATPPMRVLWIRVVNLYLLLSPWPLGTYDPNVSLFAMLSALIFFPLAGATGVFLFPFSYYGIAKNILRRSREIVCFLAIPLALVLLIQGWPGPAGLGAMHFAEPLIPLLTAFGVAVLGTRRRLLLAQYVLSLSSYIALLGWSYGQPLFAGSWHARDYVALCSLFIVSSLICLRTMKDLYGTEFSGLTYARRFRIF